MKLRNVGNLNGLFHLLDEADGNITLETADGHSYDWRSQSELLKSMTSSMALPGFRELSVYCESARDTESVMGFMMECRPARYAS